MHLQVFCLTSGPQKRANRVFSIFIYLRRLSEIAHHLPQRMRHKAWLLRGRTWGSICKPGWGYLPSATETQSPSLDWGSAVSFQEPLISSKVYSICSFDLPRNEKQMFAVMMLHTYTSESPCVLICSAHISMTGNVCWQPAVLWVHLRVVRYIYFHISVLVVVVLHCVHRLALKPMWLKSCGSHYFTHRTTIPPMTPNPLWKSHKGIYISDAASKD